jgi:hypothetical protein
MVASNTSLCLTFNPLACFIGWSYPKIHQTYNLARDESSLFYKSLCVTCRILPDMSHLTAKLDNSRKNSWLWMWKLCAWCQQVRYPRGVALTLFDIPEGILDIPEEGYDIPEELHGTNNSRKNSWLWLWKLCAGRQQVWYPRGVAQTLFDIPEEGYDIPEELHDTNNSRKNSWLWIWKLYAGRQQVRYPRGVARTLFDIPEGILDIPEGIHDTNNLRKNSWLWRLYAGCQQVRYPRVVP